MTLEPGCGVMNPVTVVPAAAIARSSLQYQQHHTTPHTHTHNGASQPTHTERHNRERASERNSFPPRNEGGGGRQPVTVGHQSAQRATTQRLGELPRNRALPVRAGGRGLDPVVPLLTAIGCGGGRRVARGNGGGSGGGGTEMLPSSVGVGSRYLVISS